MRSTAVGMRSSSATTLSTSLLVYSVATCMALSPAVMAFVQFYRTVRIRHQSYADLIALEKKLHTARNHNTLWERSPSGETEDKTVYSWNSTGASTSTIFEQSPENVPSSVGEDYPKEDTFLHERIRDAVHHRPEHYHLPSQQSSVENHDMILNENDELKSEDQGQLESATLGDIMSSGLVTEPRHSLQETYGFHNPLDRMVLTANGNLQRLISSYYDSAVSVFVDSCTPRPQKEPSNVVVWDRVVHLMIFNQTFCVATSVITVRDPLCVKLVDSGKVGLGQLFRYLDLLPEFSLVNASRNEKDGGFWREYTLQCAEVSCRIHENFVDDLWELDSKKGPS